MSVADTPPRTYPSTLTSGYPTRWTPTVYKLYLQQIVDAQAPPRPQQGDPGGFVPVVVPCHGGVDAANNDLSWTAGAPCLARATALCAACV